MHSMSKKWQSTVTCDFSLYTGISNNFKFRECMTNTSNMNRIGRKQEMAKKYRITDEWEWHQKEITEKEEWYKHAMDAMKKQFEYQLVEEELSHETALEKKV